mgnify:CR=1 FL=1
MIWTSETSRHSCAPSLLPGLRRVGLLAGLLISPTLLAWDYDLRGYVGYAGVDASEDIECNNRACQGTLEDSLFYGLSASLQGEHFGGQVIVSQDEEEEPDITLAQGTWRNQLLGLDMNLRAGKIIVPLGLYGSQRITPTTQPGLVFPQSFLLNAYYDLVTLSEEGVGLDLRGDRWGLKAAIYEPEKEAVERVVVIPGTAGPLDFLFAGLLGLDSVTGLGGTPPQVMTVVEDQNNRATYLGFDFRNVEYQVDAGWIAQELGDVRVDAYNIGLQTSIGNFQPSLEAFELDIENVESTIEGLTLNMLYSFEKWQVFATGVHIDIGQGDTEELVVGGVYYWGDGDISTRLAWRRVDGDLPGATQGLDNVDALGLSVAYSWD